MELMKESENKHCVLEDLNAKGNFKLIIHISFWQKYINSLMVLQKIHVCPGGQTIQWKYH